MNGNKSGIEVTYTGTLYKHSKAFVPSGLAYEDNIGTSTEANPLWVPTSFYVGAGWALPNGDGASWTNHFKGNIDEVAIFRRALSEAEIRSIYLKQKPD